MIKGLLKNLVVGICRHKVLLNSITPDIACAALLAFHGFLRRPFLARVCGFQVHAWRFLVCIPKYLSGQTTLRPKYIVFGHVDPEGILSPQAALGLA